MTIRSNLIQLPIDVQSVQLVKGDTVGAYAAAPDDLMTLVWLILPAYLNDLPPGAYTVGYQNHQVQLRIFQVAKQSDDLIWQLCKNFAIGGGPQPGRPYVPTIALTDNRGQYPCLAAELVFPYRLDGDILRPAPKAKISPEEQERVDLVGPDPMKEKIAALTALNRAIGDLRKLHTNLRSVDVEDVTAQITTFVRKEDRVGLVQATSLLTTKTAYRDAATDYYLGQQATAVRMAAAALHARLPDSPRTLPELHDLVLAVIDGVLVHHVETRRWIEPFWDGDRRIMSSVGEICVARSPKGETDIQPTLHVVLQMGLAPYGVQVIRESDEGVGSLDFRVTSTAHGKALNVAVEFKLAHHKRIEHGIKRQLPACMRAIPTSHGVFAVMWFRDADGKVFAKPKRDKEETQRWLRQCATDLAKEGLEVAVRLVDASVRPSASTL